MEKRRPEILAPAGNPEKLEAAVRSGCDGVYLGLKELSARSYAGNFSTDELREAVKYCRARNVKTYLAMNTLVTDDELPHTVQLIKEAAKTGIDAVIVQDLGILKIWREVCPDVKLNASTQMTVTDISGEKAAAKLGITRVVLPRELSEKEIEIMNAGIVDTEVFIHGALCVSVSGTCLLSSFIGARSGNRGKCAQPCRLDSVCKGRHYALSLKDMSLIEKLPELEKAGVSSLKIEGRMKRPEYVSEAVSDSVKSLNGENFETETLKNVFSRQGFTDGYFTGKRNISMFGHRSKDDVENSGSEFGKIHENYRRERQSVKISFFLSEEEKNGEKYAVLTASDGKNTVSAEEKCGVNEYGKNLISSKLNKTGGTIYIPENIVCPEKIRISPGQISDLRRKVLDSLTEKREKIPDRKINDFNLVLNSARRKNIDDIRLRFEKTEQIFDRSEKIILPIDEIISNPHISEKYFVSAELPFVTFPSDEENLKVKLEKLKSAGITDVYADNISNAYLAAEKGFKVHGGHGLNVLNSVAASEYGELGIDDLTSSVELNFEKFKMMRSMCDIPLGIICYGHIPLMTFRSCPARTEKGCSGCTGLSDLNDRTGRIFKIICRNKKFSQLLNSEPLFVEKDKLPPSDFQTLYFTYETKEECEHIYDLFIKGKTIEGKKTRGLYYRELL